MALLSDEKRIETWERLMRENRDVISINKNELRAAVNAIDQFLESNSANINNAFPTAAKNGLSAGQKALVVAYVALNRYGVI